MAEVGLVSSATVAVAIGQAVVPAYRGKFANPPFTPLQLLAMPGLMRDEDTTCREAEVRLAEHAEWRTALGLQRVPADPTL